MSLLDEINKQIIETDNEIDNLTSRLKDAKRRKDVLDKLWKQTIKGEQLDRFKEGE